MKITEETLLKFGFKPVVTSGNKLWYFTLEAGPVRFQINLDRQTLAISTKNRPMAIKIPLPDDHYRLWLLYKGFTGEDLPVIFR